MHNAINSKKTIPLKDFSQKLLVWFDEFGRRNLPWQTKPADPYFVWLSEVMLQQTSVATVIDYFNRFTQSFSTIEILANADEDTVLMHWSGLGYYQRAKNLHKTAKIIVVNYGGEFPQDFNKILALPGVGESTAGAILSLSFDLPYAILDGNVKRVLTRIYQINGHYGQSAIIKKLWWLANHHTPKKRNADYSQAIMDVGATVCTRANPKCDLCPMMMDCQAKKYQSQGQYPMPKPKKTKPTKAVAMLVFCSDKDELYFEKRSEKGIWSGLWSFVECENEPKIIQKTVKKFDKNATIIKNLPEFKHTFTHYHLWIHPVIIRCTVDKKFYRPDNITFGLPTPVGKIIQWL